MAALPNAARTWPRPGPELVPQPVPAPAIPAAEDDVAERLQKKEARIRAEAARPLDPRERYRALSDVVEEGLTLAEIADRKVRFALVVMAGLNLGVYALAVRGDLLDSVPRLWTLPWGFGYGLLAVLFLLQAVEALRPREVAARPRGPSRGRLREVAAAAEHALEDYQRAWREIRFDELASELAAEAHALAHCNREKYEALRRLYVGLRLMALMVGALFLLAAAALLLSPAAR